MTHVDGCKSDPEHTGICRDGRDHPRIHIGDGKFRSYSRASSWGKPLDDLNSLMDWKSRVTLLGAVVDPKLLDRARAVVGPTIRATPDNRNALQAVANKALELGGAHEKADRGTAVHSLTDSVDRGEPLTNLPDEIAADLKAYRNTLDEYGVEPLQIETFTVQDDLRVAGTFDRLIRVDDQFFRCPKCYSHFFIADLKTSRTANYPHSWAVQLAVYANSTPYDIDKHHRYKWATTPCPHRGLLIHLPAGQATCDLYWIDIEAGWDAAINLVPAVKKWRSRKDILERV